MTIGKVQITTQILKLGALADQGHIFLGFLSQSDVFERDFYPKTSLFGKGRTEFIWIANLEIILKSGFFKDISRVYFPPAGKLDGDSTEVQLHISSAEFQVSNYQIFCWNFVLDLTVSKQKSQHQGCMF